MAKKGVFKTDFGSERKLVEPEALFHDLKARSPEIKHLWSQQADLLRSYHKSYLRANDIALELPTGAGKTLVGLLIAESRRRNFNERVAYLCPTRQLAHQVGTLADKYDILGHVLVGKQSNYPPDKFSEYQMGKAITVTTYSGLFNSSPRICDPNVIILDDAHGSETYISSMWSVEIEREKEGELYTAILKLFADVLPSAFVESVTSDEGYPSQQRIVEVVPGRDFREKMSALRDFLDSNLTGGRPAEYSWQAIREHLPACNMFICRDCILLRPIIPPTMSHSPFSDAHQRVYMSATLGSGGELERITGVRKIDRLPIPPGWDSRGTGRRLFLVPQMAMDDNDAIRTTMVAIKSVDRSLVLVPNQFERQVFKEILNTAGITVIGSLEIEDSISSFTTKASVALLLSRYDGLDLPDEACRLLVLWGLPGGTNLQERFLLSRLAAASLLRDRILTRLTQGVGRCTRSNNDYAVVFLLDRTLVDFLLKTEHRNVLHPELQAELEFGIENSRGKESVGFIELCEVFLSQDEEWREADKAIIGLRETKIRQRDPIADRLMQVVSDEVDYLYLLWTGNYEQALEKAKSVSDSLGGDETKGYRGWWYYLTGDAALMLHEENAMDSFFGVAKDYFKRAGSCSLAISWFARLARTLPVASEVQGADERTATAVEVIKDQLKALGLVGKNFENQVSSALSDIRSDEYKNFHRGLDKLGKFLGFETMSPKEDGSPDCVWSIGNMIHIVHEAKTEHKPDKPIGINDVRQAEGHANWVQSHCPCQETTEIVCVIETPRSSVSKGAVPHAKTLCRVDPSEIRHVAQQIVTLLRTARAGASDVGDETLLENILLKLQEARLRPVDIINTFLSQPVNKLPAI